MAYAAATAQRIGLPDGLHAALYGWYRASSFLIVAALLAMLPYGGALGWWMAATLPADLLAIRASSRIHRPCWSHSPSRRKTGFLPRLR